MVILLMLLAGCSVNSMCSSQFVVRVTLELMIRVSLGFTFIIIHIQTYLDTSL
ncbi:hypothetical protein Q666_04165 [Marinobacter sp. ES-1]|nr:hypothetical protein Q666_04165 [Marinobacter sp. ES-1]